MQRQDPLPILIAFAVAATLFNLAVAVAARVGSTQTLLSLSYALASGLVSFLLTGVVVMGVTTLLARGALSSARAAVTSGLVLLSASFYWPIHALLRASLSEDLLPVQQGLVHLGLLAGAALLPLLGLLVRWNPRATTATSGTARSAPLLFLVLLSLATLVYCWLQTHIIEGLFSLGSILCTVLFVLVLMVALAISRRQGPRELPAVVAMALLILLSPLATSATRLQWSGSGTGKISARAPACLLITVDTLRADALSTLDPSTTPAIASLMRESVSFVNARSPSPWTKPAMASVLSGLSPLTHRTVDTASRLPEEVSTLAEYFNRAGYRTAAIGRNTFLSERFRFDQGFREYYFFPNAAGGTFGGPLLRWALPLAFRPDASTTELTDFGITWMRDHRSEPFLLWLHYFDPHLPYAPPQRLLGDTEPAVGSSFADLDGVRDGTLQLTAEERSGIRELYDAEVRYVDQAIGRLSDALRELGLYDSTLIVLTSDHGEEFWEHGSFEHGHSLYDEVLRVPLAFKLPDSASTGIVEAPVSTESLTPTILDLVGIEHRGEFSSPSLGGMLAGEAPAEASEPVFGSSVLYYGDKRSVVFGDHKYIRDLVTGDEELYDLERDRAESHSVTASSAHLLEEGRALLDARLLEAEELRNRLELLGESVDDLDPETLEELRSLGYVN